MGEYTVVPHLDRVPQLSQFDPEQCLIGWDVILTTKSGEQEVRDAFMFVEDRAEVIVEQIDDLSVYEEGAYKRLGEILAERGAAPRETIESTAQQQRRLGEMLVDEGVAEDEVQSALAEQQHVQRTRERVQSELSTSSIRVSSEKLDNLVDLVGEIVTLQARLSSTAQETGLSSVQSIAESFERLTDELRDSTMSIRMVPLGSTFTRFRRVVRDLSQELGKEVELVTTGGDTELDKTVIDKLNDPLVHVIRNAIDHGLESPQAREEAGKSRKGTVRLSAEYAGATVIVRIVDDGRGMDRDAIAQKAVDRGVVESTSGLSEEEIFKLIFEPGFSTAENVTSVSGRGVGMDVVKREIENLGGGVRVQSRQGQGTEIALEIPLTLAIIDGLLVQLGEEYYVFPLGAVEECIELDKASEEDESILSNRGEALPYRRLRSLFRIAGEVPERQQIVVTSTQSGKVGFVVDKVLGDMQTVIKNLGRVFRDLDGMSGATILGDGSVALILDVQRLIVMSGHGQQAAASA
jgi:two-component system chemotaxis sensor kinase CheA